MDDSSVTLTVFFEGQFYVGLVERTENSKLTVCRIVFGAEPKDYEVYHALLEHFGELRFSPSITEERKPEAAVNPKRMQRDASRQLAQSGVGTKAQQALKLQHEQNKLEHRERSREQREADEARRFQQKQDKRKEKHRGH